jgi:hypothetical protein
MLDVESAENKVKTTELKEQSSENYINFAKHLKHTIVIDRLAPKTRKSIIRSKNCHNVSTEL